MLLPPLFDLLFGGRRFLLVQTRFTREVQRLRWKRKARSRFLDDPHNP